MVLLILAVIWAAALLPPLVRSRLEGNPVDSIGRFRRHLRVLQSTSPAANSLANDPVMAQVGHSQQSLSMPATWANEARRLRKLRRRRQISSVLLALMGSTLVLGLVPSLQPVLVLHVITDVMFAGWVGLLVRARSIETDREMRAHFANLRDVAAADNVGDGAAVAGTALQQQAY